MVEDRNRDQDRMAKIEIEKMREYDEKMRAKLEEEYKVKMNNSKAISD